MTGVNHTDNELLQLLSQGDKEAFDTLYTRYWKEMFMSAYQRLKDVDQCKDIIQDIWADIWVRRGSVEIQNLRSYLLSAVRFQVFKMIERGQDSPTFFAPFQQMAFTGTGADGSVMEKELAALFRSWLNTLPEKRREIFILHFANKLSVKEIAERLNISTKTVQNQLGTAVSDLRSRLAGILLQFV
ncbi:MAG: sigma-70 family RNA polymerase sigma factor [Sphingobacteriales bacterium]|nr:sigma-70 family RNA polymerase sigma factor [Sphingobacteriales bacterium]OJW01971.1 MAG: hypothetical protein BGO52_00365 [Sphingobacteriales bacterium 44-61]